MIIGNFNLTYNDFIKNKHFNLESVKCEIWKTNILTELLRMKEERSFKVLAPQAVEFMIFKICA